jgi:hypothetical protein
MERTPFESGITKNISFNTEGGMLGADNGIASAQDRLDVNEEVGPSRLDGRDFV